MIYCLPPNLVQFKLMFEHSLIAKIESGIFLYDIDYKLIQSFLKYNYLIELTTSWDVYETLLHILIDQNEIYTDLSIYFSNYIKIQRNNKKNGFSLFLPVPSRGCLEAKVPQELCSCELSLGLDLNHQKVIKGAQSMIDYINNDLLKDYSTKCVKLKLFKVIDAQTYLKYPNKYSIIFSTYPGNAIFDGSVLFNQNSNRTIKNVEVIGTISRISFYGMTSKCVNNYFLKNYCYCKIIHKSKSKY